MKGSKMRFAILLISIFLISACSRTTPVSDEIANGAIDATNGLEQQLPPECKTSAITTQLAVIKTQIRTITNACQTEKDVITEQKRKYQWAFFGLLTIVGMFITKKVLK